jgi:hypothetical protein
MFIRRIALRGMEHKRSCGEGWGVLALVRHWDTGVLEE